MKHYEHSNMEIIVWDAEEAVRTSGAPNVNIPTQEDELPVLPWPTV